MEPEPQTELDAAVEEPIEVEAGDSQEPEQQEERMVPLSAVQKERKRKRELADEAHKAKLEADYYKQLLQKQQQPQEEDPDDEEPVTRRDYEQRQAKRDFELRRQIQEESWTAANPEKYEFVEEHIAEFIKQRPHLGRAINDCTNRYAEAYALINALTPRQKQALERPASKPSPNNPAAVPKSANVSEAIDVMSMTDEEYRQWRQSKRRR